MEGVSAEKASVCAYASRERKGKGEGESNKPLSSFNRNKTVLKGLKAVLCDGGKKP
jgi:hypothetical protein